MIRKQIITASVLSVLGLVGVTGAGVIAAQAATNTANQSSLADAIAQKFSLKKSDVQNVIDENHQKNNAAREAKEGARLDQAVKDGKLTRAQKDALIAKHKEMKALFDSLKDKSHDERKAALKSARASFGQWLKDNSIPREFVKPGGHGKNSEPGEPRMGRMMSGEMSHAHGE